MNLSEQNQVMDYLKRKKLSFPLFKEVYDHFSIEIDQQMSEGKGFQESFLNTKVKWKKELELVIANPLSFQKITRLEKNVLGNHFKKITKIAFLVVILNVLISFIYEPFQVFVVFGFGFVTFGYFVYLFFKGRVSFIDYLRLSFHPLIIKSIIISLFFILGADYFTSLFANTKISIKDILRTSFIIYNLTIQFQLMILHHKKINVLMS